MQPQPSEALFFHVDEMADYSEVTKSLPLLEGATVPLGREDVVPTITAAHFGQIALLRVRIHVPSVGVNVIDPAFVGFSLPLQAAVPVIVNGRAADPGVVLPTASENEFYVRGGERDVLGVAVRRADWLETLAALQGVGPEDVVVGDGPLELSAPAGRLLSSRLASLLESVPHQARMDAGDEAFGMLLEAYLSTRSETSRKAPARAQSPSQLVRRAEERFAAAEGAPVSLADLCASAGVSKSTLYRAFDAVCGAPPLSYFQKRRLLKARSILLGSTAERGAVKRAALRVGITEFGRFSVDYRRLFGEAPSATLHTDVGGRREVHEGDASSPAAAGQPVREPDPRAGEAIQ